VAQTLETQRYVEFRVQASELPTDAYAVDVFDSGAPPARAVDHFVIRVSHAATPQN
jgi:hypothetical protein